MGTYLSTFSIAIMFLIYFFWYNKKILQAQYLHDGSRRQIKTY